jgi:hypothetical protein
MRELEPFSSIGGKWGLTHPGCRGEQLAKQATSPKEIAAFGDFREDTRPMCEHEPSSHLEESGVSHALRKAGL